METKFNIGDTIYYTADDKILSMRVGCIIVEGSVVQYLDDRYSRDFVVEEHAFENYIEAGNHIIEQLEARVNKILFKMKDHGAGV